MKFSLVLMAGLTILTTVAASAQMMHHPMMHHHMMHHMMMHHHMMRHHMMMHHMH